MSETKDSKIIFKNYISRRLIKMGNRVIDIKPDHEDPRRTLCVFQVDEKFQNDLSTVLNDLADERINKAAKSKSVEKE